MSFRKPLHELDLALTPNNAIGFAYQQYVTDKRLDTFDDDEAFTDAIFTHIIDPIEALLDRLTQDVERHQDHIQEEIDAAQNDLLDLLGVR